MTVPATAAAMGCTVRVGLALATPEGARGSHAPKR